MPAPVTSTKPEGHECHWLRGTYDPTKDQWQWTVIVSDNSNSRYKCGGINFVDGMVYWISDANGPEPHDRGIFRCAPADIANPQAHTMLFNPQVESANMIIQDGVILASHCATASPLATGIHRLPGSGQDVGAIRSQGVRQTVPRPLQREEQ